MQRRKLGTTDLSIAPLVLGGNVFGWTADKKTSFAILDRFLEAGFNTIDTADIYNRFAPGLVGGESETILGKWIADRKIRDKIVLITKGGLDMGSGEEGLGRDYLPKACAASLKRLKTDYIDVYMAHRADPNTPIEETLEAFQGLIDAGQIRYAGCSNYTPEQQVAALCAGGMGRSHYQVVQPHYNVIDRHRYEDALEKISSDGAMGVIAYYALAAGFLTGKYRTERDLAGSARTRVVSQYLNPRGMRVLDTLAAVAARHEATLAQTALSWVMARPSVTAPIASATNIKQLDEIIASVDVHLTDEDLSEIAASVTPP